MGVMLHDSRAEDVVKRQADMQSERSGFEQQWREIAARMGHSQAFNGETVNPGEKKTQLQFDDTAPLALDRFAAAIESILTPRSSRWHKMAVVDPRVKQSMASRRWCEEVTDLLFRIRYSPRGNFASSMHEVYLSLGEFGTGGVFVNDDMGRGIRYSAMHLSEIYIDQDYTGRIDTVHRRFEMTARQAMQWFSKKPRTGSMPEKIRTAAEKEPSKKFWFIHCVRPNHDIMVGRRDYRGWALSSYYISEEGKCMLDEGGYRVMPYAVSRYVTGAREVYGRSPAMTVLPTIKMANEQEKTNLRAAHRRVEPPLLAKQEGALAGFNTTPNAINYGGLDSQGNPTIRPLDTRADIGIGIEFLERSHKVINDAFLVTLFQVLVENNTMTATEAMYRAQEKGALLAPTGGRQQSELLGIIIERELDIMNAAGLLPPMPRELLEIGGNVEIEYTSPLALAQRADEGVGIMRSIEMMGPLAQFDNGRSMRRINTDKTMQRVWEINGAPADLLHTDEELAAKDEQEAQAVQAQQMLEAAPIAAQAAKTMSEANAISNKAGPVGGVP